jgi:lipopolysaccharide heptosyltransferase I
VDSAQGHSCLSVQEYARILLIKPSSLGDIVHAIPVVSAVKERWPKAQITWVVKRQWADLVECVEGVDRVWPLATTAMGWLHQVRALRAERFDLAVDLQGLFRSGALAGLSGAPERIGFANGREGSPWFYSTRVPVPSPDMHAVDRYLLVAQALGASATRPPQFRFVVNDSDAMFVRHEFQRYGLSVDQSWIAVHISARWPTKRWPLESFAAVLDRLEKERLGPTVLIGASDDRTDVDRLRSLGTTAFIDLTGRVPLRCLPATLSKASIMITNDSGPMHIAAAFGVPVVAMFGPTSAARTGPYGKGHHVLSEAVPCSPCFSRVCRHSPHMECLYRIQPNQVVEAVRRLLATHARMP